MRKLSTAAAGVIRKRRDQARTRLKLLVAPLTMRERYIYSALILLFVSLLVAPRITADIGDEGSIFSVAATQCSSSDVWLYPQNITGQPSNGINPDRSGLTASNSALWTGQAGALECTDYSPIPEHNRINNGVSITLKAINKAHQDLLQETAIQPNVAVLQDGAILNQRISQRPQLEEPNIFASEGINPIIDNLLLLSISDDNGYTWHPLHSFGNEILTTTKTTFDVAIPVQFVSESKTLAFKLDAVINDPDVSILIDSINWTYEVGPATDVVGRLIDADSGLILSGELPVLNQSDDFLVEIGIKDVNDGLWQGLRKKATNLVGQATPPAIDITATLLDAQGNEIRKSSVSATHTGTDLSNTDIWQSSINIMPPSADPGEYTLELQISTTDNGTQTITQDFLWGVLALNTDRDSYKLGETAQIDMTVLDETGATLCDADLSLTISGPTSSITQTTNDGIALGDKCQLYGTHIDPDYSASYEFNELGPHEISLTATTENGQFVVSQSINVLAEHDIRISRVGPTRIYPIVGYPMTISVESRSGFTGVIEEVVPLAFDITPLDFVAPYQSIAIIGDSQHIFWDVTIPAGESIDIGYRFDAPDISPEFYLLGGLVLTDPTETVVYEEARQWQIAGDAVNVYRVTTYEVQTAQFTGATYTLTLNNNLKADYFTVISGPTDDANSRPPNEDSIRVTGDPFGNVTNTTSVNQLEFTRAAATNDWIGAVSVVECLIECDTLGFQLLEVLETSLPLGSANTIQTTTATLAANHTSRTIPFGGHNGGGITTTATSNNDYAVSLAVKVSKIGTNQIEFERYGSENRVPGAGDITTHIVEWGSEWTVQGVNVTGTNSGTGIDATGEYNTATITSTTRDNTWVWGSGYTRDDGLGDGGLGQVITLGDGVSQNTSETLVAVGAERAMITPGRDFEVYVMEHASLAVDYRFKVRGDAGAGSGFQELNIAIDAENSSETYDNSATTIQYTEGKRLPFVTTTSSGSGQAYSRTGAWGARITTSTNLNYWRAYSGTNVTAWMHIVDFGNITFSNVDTRQDGFRWRDDTADLNTSSGWLAAEDINPAAQNKLTDLRLRVRAANNGTTPEEAARTYELQFASKLGFSTCSGPTSWTGIADSATDDFEMYTTSHIDPDGEATTTSHLASGGFTYVNGEGRELLDTTGNVGPMGASSYTELEYTIRPTTDSVTGRTYCFRLFDTAASAVLDQYVDFPELTITNTQIVTDNGLGEVGSFTSQIDGGWTTITYAATYTTPVVVGVTNTQDNQNALVFETRNVTTTSAQLRVCESEGSTANGCDTHAAETVGYMIVDAAVAATTPGIEAGTFVTSGRSDNTNVTTNFAETFTSTPYVFANINTVTSAQFPIEVVIRSTAVGNFNAGICDHLLSNNNLCDSAHGNETVGWVAIEPGNEPFWEQFDNNSQSIDTDGGSWVSVTYTPAFNDVPVMLLASQTDTGGQDVEIEGTNSITKAGGDIRFCEIDATDTCDTHSADTVVWHAMEAGVIDEVVELDQDGFRFYSNTNAIQPTVSLGNEDAAIANVANGDIVRIRLGLQNGDTQDLPVSTTDFTLQYSQATDCAAAGTWTDVGGLGSATIWRGFNNTTPADGATITASLLDSAGNTLMSYEEANDSVTNPTLLSKANRGEWDWVIENNGATNFTSYCFRTITVGNDTLHYSIYPRLTTSSGEAPLDPNSPASLGQEKTGGASITVGDVINETSVVFTANVSDGNTSDILELCVEVVDLTTTFINTQTACGDPVVYSGTAVAATVEISGMQNLVSYHWQARVRDAAGALSAWVSFGGNPETAADYSVDTEPPGVTVYDGTTTGIDIDFNGSELDQLSANWEDFNGIQPDSIASLAVWLDGMDIDGDGITTDNPANGANITTWTDKSTNTNDATDVGFTSPTYNATSNTVEFANATQKLSATALAGNSTGNVPKTFIVVHRLSGTADDDGGGVRLGQDASGTSANMHLNETRRVRYGGGNNVFGPTLTTAISVTSLSTSAGSSVNLEMFVNGVSQGNGTDTSTWALGDDLYLNADFPTASNQTDTPADISLAEVLVFDSQLSTNDREEIEEYLMCKWSVIDCSNTYERSIGTSPGGTNILAWTSSGASTSSTDTALTLNTNQPYYYNVRATDVAGNQAIFSSDGQFVAPSLNFTVSAGSLDLGHLNLGNSYTSTGTTTLTTSTNAYNGYVVRGYATGLLSSGVNTIGMFNGGTYLNPDTWLAGDTGYGYTSSDTTIQGSNKFNGTPCGGGGSPPCYAPWSQTSPGDIIADHTSLVSGTAIVAEGFTITHRVTSDAAQTDGDYTTTIVYNITATY